VIKRLILMLLLTAPAYAQMGTPLPPRPTAPPDPPQTQLLDVPTVVNQLAAAGCQSERQIAAQTIVQLQAKVTDLQRQLDASKAAGKSGATKH
jgi:hypothetical protein